MAAVKFESTIKRAPIFEAKEDGWSETVDITFEDKCDGYVFNKETGEKEFTKVNHLSFFTSELIKVLSEDSDIAGFLAAKTHNERLKLLPVLLSGAKIIIILEHDGTNKKMLHSVERVILTEAMMTRIQKALDELFGF